MDASSLKSRLLNDGGLGDAEAAPLQIHLCGIAGVGVAGLARLLLARGHRVSGSDLAQNALTNWLQEHGVTVYHGHDANYLADAADLLIRSAAVPDRNPEVTKARAFGIPVAQRGEILPILLDQPCSVAVSGTHGKTTTSAMIAHVMQQADQSPGYFVGGESPQFDGVAGPGDGRFFVAECDESDGTIRHYHPRLGVVTNIEFDHMETFGSEDAFLACFDTFAEQCEQLILCGDDPQAARLARSNSILYGFDSGFPISASDVRQEGRCMRFTLHLHGKSVDACLTSTPGVHHVLNALAAAAVCHEAGCDLDQIVAGLESFQSVGRRFETVVNQAGIQIIEDYAHHPTEVAALIRSTQGMDPQRIFMIYQPHRYSRTLALKDDFPASFVGLDQLMLVPVYAASEAPLEGGRSVDLVASAQQQGVSALYAESLVEAWGRIYPTLRAGDVLLIAGAGDVNQISVWARDTFAASADL